MTTAGASGKTGVAFLRDVPLFRGIDPETFDAIAQDIQWFCLPGGWTLFEQGAKANALYIVTSGSLGVFVKNADGTRHQLSRIRVGETVGEMAMISGDPRTATIIALRDSSLLRLAKPAFDELVTKHPAALVWVSRFLVERLKLATQRIQQVALPQTFALLPLGPSVSCRDLSEALAAVCRRDSRRVHVLEPDAAARSGDWFHEIESANDAIFYCAETEPSSWTRQCIRQADRVLLVASAQDDPNAARPLDQLLDGDRLATAELLLLQPNNRRRPIPAGPWLRKVGAPRHFHIRAGHQPDLERVGRYLVGRAVGLVLSGGGARGFGHLGVIKALREAGLPIDFIAGTSIGSIVGAGTAMDIDDETLMDRMQQAFGRGDVLNDYTVPILALTRGRRASARLREHFGDRQIEDLWLPFRCISSNLTTGTVKVHDRGPVWRALRASISIPGLLPPVIEHGHVLVDGAIMNNLPTELISEVSDGPIVGIDVTSNWAVRSDIENLESMSLFQLMFRHRQKVPSIVSLLMRAGMVSSDAQTRLSRAALDLLIEPPLDAIGIGDWHALQSARDIAYRHTVQLIENGGLKLPFG